MYKYTVSQNQKLTDSTLLLTLKKEADSKPLLFRPGQYAAISFIGKNGRPTAARCFSMVNSPIDQSTLQFSIRIFGKYTKAISALKAGDRVSVSGPYGGFVINEDTDRDIVMIAGGIGITPLISIIHYATNLELPNKIKLIYSCKDQDDVPFIKQLTDLSQANPNFQANFAISSGPIDKLQVGNVFQGRITTDAIGKVVDGSFDDKRYFICGPATFMKAISKDLRQNGVSEQNIITEAFNSGNGGKPGNLFTWPLSVYALGAVGFAAASFAIILSDFIKSLPPSSLMGTSNLVDSTNTTNSRQQELDKLVNKLPANSSTQPASSAAINAGETNPTSTKSGTQSTAQTSTATTTTPVAPKCTTSQSGITTCV